MGKIKIGIVGTGKTIGIAQMHILAFQRLPEVEIVALYDIIPEMAEDYLKRFDLPNAKVCTSYEELLSLSDAVIICTPNSTHTDYSIRAIEAGKHVLSEKPFGLSKEQCKPALEYSKLTNKVCMVGFCYRGVPAFRYIKKLVSENKLGNIYYVQQAQGGDRIGNPDVKLEWRMQKALSGPGASSDFGSHLLDMVDWILQDQYGEIVELQAMNETFIKERQEVFTDKKSLVTNDDVAVFNAKTEKGVLISNAASRIGIKTFMEVYGSNGYAIYNAENPFAVTVALKNEDGVLKEPKIIDVPEDLYLEGDNTPREGFLINFYLQAKSFVEAIQENKPFENTFERGYYIQNLLDLIHESAELKTTVFVEKER